MLMLMQMQCNYGAKHLRCYNSVKLVHNLLGIHSACDPRNNSENKNSDYINSWYFGTVKDWEILGHRRCVLINFFVQDALSRLFSFLGGKVIFTS
jgi:hypothetical protein